MDDDVVRLGGDDLEALYLEDADFQLTSGKRVIVRRSAAADANVVARHKARYYPAGLFCRPGHRMLDFPCGSGYASVIFRPFGVIYEGLDVHEAGVEYARRVYGGQDVSFDVADLRRPNLSQDRYDVITCIEGIEHIDQQYQAPLIAALHRALRLGGVLIISSPENNTGQSGPNPHNKYHLHELTKADFMTLLTNQFGDRIEPIHFREVLTDRTVHTCWVVMCHRVA